MQSLSTASFLLYRAFSIQIGWQNRRTMQILFAGASGCSVGFADSGYELESVLQSLPLPPYPPTPTPTTRTTTTTTYYYSAPTVTTTATTTTPTTSTVLQLVIVLQRLVKLQDYCNNRDKTVREVG